MRSPEHRLAALALAFVATGVAGCADDDPGATESSAWSTPNGDAFRLGRVHVVLEPEADSADEPYEVFEVTARFAFVRSLEEDFVRARIGMPVLPADVVTPGECVPSDSLTISGSEVHDVPPSSELSLVDAGDLRIRIDGEGGTVFEAPMELSHVPDLLPYMTSGYFYTFYGEDLPELPDDGRSAMVVVESRASLSEELPEFRAEGVVPRALVPYVTEDDLQALADDALVLRWQGRNETETDDGIVTVRLTGLQGGLPVGSELTCVLHDQGQVRLSLDTLRTFGLALDAQALRITYSRMGVASFDAGDFIGNEMLVERREKVVLPLR
ncbi:hypothetical protein [Paraliomyxa miuraensis]|uniref:hypothetical protein n=1 Tax=Paraliomyxa miuraensis TaxID=376150 RepID=UPI002257C9A1|nr:hypothetical protein [Paraliomyxa miuraensis]MCX4246196.1 hypothetical protein [Paraliomyxa miuraensis]